ncbi:MAG: hypothetical protein KY459_08870 [Acidobacteria bacterium]|nr:hypothetical protein [Acidobacteriota bacterium]
MGVRGTADDTRWELSHRYITDQIPRATHRTIVTHQLHPDLKIGLEWNAQADEIGLVANWRAVSETELRPAVVFGTSSDRIGTPDGQSYFVTVSKSLHHLTDLAIAPYAGASYSEHEDGFIYPFGVNVALGRNWSAMLSNDGVHTHLSSTWSWRRTSLTLLAVRLEDPGLTVGLRF